MSVTFRKLFSVLVALWAIRHIEATLSLPDEVQMLWGVGAFMWILAAIYMFIGRHVRTVSYVILALIGLEFVAAGLSNREGLTMLAWLTFIVAVTEGRPTERALLVRVSATVVYVFGALSKLNPSWLTGEGILSLPEVHPPFAWASGPLSAPSVATVAAVTVILVELLLPVGLWSARFRPYAAAAGLAMHVTFVATLARSPFSLLHLVMLNGGLVLSYLAFWAPIRASAVQNEEPLRARPPGFTSLPGALLRHHVRPAAEREPPLPGMTVERPSG